MKKLITAGLALVISLSAQAQEMKELPINRLIDNPTAGILPRGAFDFDMTLYAEGGVLMGVNFGLLDRLNMGASFGGQGVVSDQSPDWNARPELAVKYRLIDESITWPALALGYSGQGHGRWIEFENGTKDRYEVKAKGFFLTAGKNFILGNMGLLGLHAGVNLNGIENDDDQGLNLWIAADKQINDELAVISEYNFGFDDYKTGLSGKKGFLNLGLRWTFAERLALELDFKDVLKNRKTSDGTLSDGTTLKESRVVESISREIKISYVEFF
jgi:hypothetical protein